MTLSLQNRYIQTQRMFWLVLLCLFLGKVKAQEISNLKKQKPFEIRGSLSAGMWFYGSNGIANRRQPFSWYLTGSPAIKIYGISFPVTMTFSEQERRFSQPFNYYGVSPYYKWIKLHLGYRNVRFSDFTLAGANFLGAGVELTPKNLRLGFVYGQFARPIEEDASGTDPRYSYLRPTFQRLGFAAKVGFGKPKAYVDFTLFEAHDVRESIQKPSVRSRVTPMQNLATGVKTHFGLFKNHLLFDFDLGASLLTRNLYKHDIENPAPWQKTLLDYFAINNSTVFFTAARGGTSLSFQGGSFRLDYQRIDPDYQSLGAYFFQNDVEQVTFSPSFSLFKNRLMVSGSYGRSHDNLNGKKPATTYRNVGAVNLSASIVPQLSINLSYSNFGVGQSRGLGDLFNDSLAVSVVNSSYSGSVNYSVGSRVRTHSFGLMATYQNTNDQNQFTRQFTGASSFVSALNYNFFWQPQKLNVGTSFSYVAIQTGGKDLVYVGPSINVSKEWMKGFLRTNLNHNSQIRTADGQNDGLMTNTGANVAFVRKKQTLSIGLNYLSNRYNAQADALNFIDFTEYRGTITYGIRF